MSKLKVIFAFFILMLTFSAVSAQIEDEPDDAPPPGERPMRRPNLLRELGLTDVQIRQLRTINEQNRPRLKTAQEKMRNAKRALDEAIYADAVDNANIELKLREFSAAESEINRIRATTELAVRNVLTPEQLTRFRELRANFEERLEERRNRRKERKGERRNPRRDRQLPPNRRLNRQNRP